jgi:DNA polymerase-1
MQSFGVDTSIIDKKTGAIKESVARQVLEKQIKKDPIIGSYLSYKESAKESSVYGEMFLKHVNPISNRVHSSFMQIMRTGRTSSTNPNIQNIKRGAIYRSAFQAEEGNVFVGADFSNIEARILADKCGDVNFRAAFDNDGDYHLATARLAFEDPTLQKDSEERRLAKNINFSIAYGGGAGTLYEKYRIPLKRGKELIEKVYKGFPKLRPYFDRQGQLAKENGYIVANELTKRRSYIPFFDKYKTMKAHIETFTRRGWEPHPHVVRDCRMLEAKIQRWAQNIPIQATAADVAKQAGIYLRQRSKKIGFDIVIFAHDEYVVECAEWKKKAVSLALERSCSEAVNKFLTIAVPAVAEDSTH